jgi:hypothetical protein
MSEASFKEAVLAAAVRALRPLARLMLASGITFREFNGLAKRVFVSVASDEFGRAGRPTNVSRISLMTGLARKDVKHLRDELGEAPRLDGPGPKTTEATRLLGAWHQLPPYLDAAGEPLAIPLTGPAPSFEALHHEHGGDIPATTMKKDLERVGAIRVEPDGRLRPLTRYFMPVPLESTAVLRAGDVLLTVGNTVTLNLTRAPASEGRFEGRATHARIPAAAAAEFRAFLEAEGMRFLEQADDWLARHAAESAAASAHDVRLGVGVYQIQEHADTPASNPSDTTNTN